MSTGESTRPVPDGGDQASRPVGRRRLATMRGLPVSDIPDDELTPRVRTVVSSLVEEVERLRADLAHSERRAADLATMADADPLLGTLNRRAFARELARAASCARRYGTMLSLIYLDLDDFKTVNDRHGHLTGDLVLRRVAAVLADHVRGSDIVGRMGGDEFAVALVRADYDVAERKGRQLAAAIAGETVACPGGTVSVAVTAGVAQLAGDEAVETLIDRADRAMYGNKPARQPGRR